MREFTKEEVLKITHLTFQLQNELNKDIKDENKYRTVTSHIDEYAKPQTILLKVSEKSMLIPKIKELTEEFADELEHLIGRPVSRHVECNDVDVHRIHIVVNSPSDKRKRDE